MSKNLSDIRVEIDSIDNQVHDLFMRRAALVSSVAAVKKKEGLQIVHPAREAKMMRRLLSRHEGVLPKSTIIRIWRELISSVSLLQTGLSVVVSSDKYWDSAKNYFGSQIPMKISDNALDEVKEGGAYFAVLPWAENPWWVSLFNQKELSIICALPYGKLISGEDKALVVSKIEFMPSDDDISFIGLELNSEISRDLIIEYAKSANITVINISKDREFRYLLEAKGFIDASSKSMTAFKKLLDGKYLYCDVIGGYPIISNI